MSLGMQLKVSDEITGKLENPAQLHITPNCLPSGKSNVVDSKNELSKTVRLTSFYNNHNFQSVLIFFKFVHPVFPVLLHLLYS